MPTSSPTWLRHWTKLGRELGARAFATTPVGYRALLAWCRHFGQVERFGIEGTGSYGAGLTRWLRAQGYAVVEVARPDRKTRRHQAKSDALDAVAAARAVQAAVATAQPKAGTGPIEMIRTLQATRRSALKARTQTANQLPALVVTAPEPLRSHLRRLSLARPVGTAAALRPGPAVGTPLHATKLALRCLALRHQHLTAQIQRLDQQLELLAVKGISTVTAATLLVTAGDNPVRLRSEGLSKPELVRCLKRSLAREL